MTYLQYGVTYNKNSSGVYKPLTNLLIKTDSVTWTPVKTAWYKRSDGVWERIYPTPQGVNTANVAALTFNPYQYYQDVPAQTFSVTNTGDYPLVINNVFINDSVGNYTTVGFKANLPATLQPAQSVNFPINVFGNTVGTGFTGSLNFINYVGYLGYANTNIPVTVNVRSDYNGIAVSSSTVSLPYYVLDTPASTIVTIKNSGNGSNLTVSSITTQTGCVSVSGISTPVTLGGVFNTSHFNTIFTGNTATFTVTAANLNVGTYTDTITINSNAANTPVLTIPVTITVTQPNGLTALTNPGTYTFTVPAHVHRLNVVATGGGGGGGAALANGYYPLGTGYVYQGGGGGGGGSGGHSLQTVAVTPGESLTVNIGDGGSLGTYNNGKFFPVSLSYSWGSFMNTYAVWTNADGYSPINTTVTSRRLFTAPYTGNYTFEYAADDTVTIQVDGSQVVSYSGFASSATTVVAMSQGNRTLTFLSLNTGGPGGFALTIRDTSNTIIWTTRTSLDSWAGTNGGTTTVTGSFGTITVGGGGAGGGAYDDYVPSSGDGGGGSGDSGDGD
jgi:hypothetical protein